MPRLNFVYAQKDGGSLPKEAVNRKFSANCKYSLQSRGVKTTRSIVEFLLSKKQKQWRSANCNYTLLSRFRLLFNFVMKTKCSLLVVNKYLIQPAQKEITLSKAGYFASISELISLEWWTTFTVGCDSPRLQGIRCSEVRNENIVSRSLSKLGYSLKWELYSWCQQRLIRLPFIKCPDFWR